jgi:hypothetical protein
LKSVDSLKRRPKNMIDRGSRAGVASRISDEDLRRVVLSNIQARTLVQDNEELFAEVVRAALTKEDVAAVGYATNQE